MFSTKNLKRNISKAIKQPGYAFSILLKRIRTFLLYKFSTKAFNPESITLFLTYNCNLKCKMCGQWGEKGSSRLFTEDKIREQLTFDELKNFIDEVSDFKPNITFFGGEPLLHKSCIDLIRYIKGKNMHCILLTNASLLKLRAKELVDSNLDELNISLDGPSDVHDNIRGMKGLFDRIREGVMEINRYKKNKPLINLEFTISSENYRYIPDMLKVAEDFNANSLNYHHLIFIDEDTYKVHNQIFYNLFNSPSDEWKGFILNGKNNIDLDYLCNVIDEIQCKKYNFSVVFYPNLSSSEIRRYYDSKRFIPSEYPKRCLSPWMQTYVFPNGDVRPCLDFCYVLGNIKDQKFKDIWNNEKYRYFRMHQRRLKLFPVCSKCTEFYRY